MTARLLLAGLMAAICLICPLPSLAQQVSPPGWMVTQPAAPSQSTPLVDKLVAEFDEGYGSPGYGSPGYGSPGYGSPGYGEYDRVEPSATEQGSPISGVKRFWNKFWLESRRNNAWPYPYLYADRAAVRAPFVTMVNNGWRRQNTLGEYHFREGSNALTEAGEMKVRWILLEGPIQHRTIYVHNARVAEQTAKRVDAVQQLAIKLMPTGTLPAVLQTNIGPAGWPAGQVDNIDRKFLSSAPAPRLPEASSTGDINQ